jgi:cell division protein FtsA
VGGLVDIVSNPMYATGVGLVQYALKNQTDRDLHRFSNGRLFFKVAGRMKDWMNEFF